MKHTTYSVLRKHLRGCYLSICGSIVKPSDGIHIISGHMSHPSAPDIKYMEHTMSCLSTHVRFIRFEDAVQMIENRVQPNEPLCAFTFDDGFEEMYDCIAPVLEKYNTNAAFFVSPNFVEGDEEYIKKFTEVYVDNPGKRPMRWDQLRDLQKRGFIIGAHTMDHFMMANGNKNELEYQIVQCKAVLEERLDAPCDYFAWPFGRFEHTSQLAVKMACNYYKYVFSQTNYRNYFSFDGKVINRRHFEPYWPIRHTNYFLSKSITY